MHKTSMNAMAGFVEKYLGDAPLCQFVIDIGARCCSAHGTYRHLFEERGHIYFGADLEAGPNVDVVFESEEDWGLAKNPILLPSAFDVVISGQCLEHVFDVKEWFFKMRWLVKPGGLCCIIAPWSWAEHRFPVDCWRILPDGMRWGLEKCCGFEVLDCGIPDGTRDTIGIARRPLWSA